jgi:hypothetical protein
MSLPAEKPLPDADELPFWQRKAMKDMTPRSGRACATAAAAAA